MHSSVCSYMDSCFTHKQRCASYVRVHLCLNACWFTHAHAHVCTGATVGGAFVSPCSMPAADTDFDRSSSSGKGLPSRAPRHEI